MGIVYLARDLELDRLVAVKVLSRAWLTEESMVERFRREARTVASMRHESIVSVYGVGRAEDLHYFVMDYIEGASLGSILRTYGPLSIPVTRALLYQVGSALSYAHVPGRSVVHRDIKPSNVMLDAEGKATVMDFGISKVTEAAEGLTRTGAVMGTAEYMSPEQCRGHTVTPESDQYALGVLIYAMLTGAPPFTGPFYHVLNAHQNDPVPSLAELRPDCPPEMVEATERMLAKVPGDRWPGITEAMVAMDLRPLALNDPVREELIELVRGVVSPGALHRPDSSSGDDPSDGSRSPTSIQIVPFPGELEAGEQFQLNASLLFEDGEEVGAEISWTSTDPAIARVDPDTGELVAVQAGSTVIKARSRGVEQSVALEVMPPRVAQVAIASDSVELVVGESVRLEAEARSKGGERLDRTITWSSTNPRVARVSDEGLIQATGPGTAYVLAQCEGIGAACGVEVEGAVAVEESPEPVARLELSEGPTVLGVSDTFRLQAFPRDRKGRELVRPVEWAVDDEAVLEILDDGLFRARGPGRVTIRVRCEERVVTHRVTVEAAPTVLQGEEMEPGATPGRVDSGEGGRRPIGQRGAEAEPQPSGGDRRIWWLGGVLGGVAVVAVYLVLGGLPAASGPAGVSILESESGEALTEGLQAEVGDSIGLLASVVDQDGQPLDRAVLWTTSDSTVVAIEADGLLVGRAEGVASVAAVLDGLRAETVVTIVDPPATVVITGSGGNPVEGEMRMVADDERRLDATVRGRRGTVLDRPVQWSSTNPAVASVDGEGVVRANSAGSTVIVADVEGVRQEIVVSIAEPVSPPIPADEEEDEVGGAGGPVESVEPVEGWLQLVIVPFADVYVDGELTASLQQRVGPLALAAGSHSVTFENPSFQTIDTTFVVPAGDTITHTIRLNREQNR